MSKKLSDITNPMEYFVALKEYKEKYLVCIAIKNDFFQIPIETAKLMMDFGMKNLHLEGELKEVYPRGWQGYAFVSNRGEVLLNKLAEIHMPIIEDVEVNGISVRIVSKPYRSGGRANIILDGYDLSVNQQNMNVVVFDTGSRTVIDSVCFNFYHPDKARKICTRFSDAIGVVLPEKKPEEINRTSEGFFDIDAELDKIIEKYRLDEYYPRYSQVRKANEAIKKLASEWGRNESIACISLGKTREKAQMDERHFSYNLTDVQKSQVDFLFFQIKTPITVERWGDLTVNFELYKHEVFNDIQWQSYDRIYIISSNDENYLGYWFRNRKIKYVSLCDYLSVHGIRDLQDDNEYYEFIPDKRNSHFAKNDDEMQPIYWALYEERNKYHIYPSFDFKNFFAKRIFFLAIIQRNFLLASEWIGKIVEESEDAYRYRMAFEDIKILIEKIKEKFRNRNKRDILLFWVDATEYEVMRDCMPFLFSLRDKSIWFENAIALCGYTRETLRALFTGKQLIEDNTENINDINVFNSELLYKISQKRYRTIMNIDLGVFSNLLGKGCFSKYQDSSELLWRTLRDCLLSNEPIFVLNHFLTESHEPWFSEELNDEQIYDWPQRRHPSLKALDRILKFYIDIMSPSATSIIFSDHGQNPHFRQHVFFAIYGKLYRQRKISGMFSTIKFCKLVEQILDYGDIHENELVGNFARIEGVPILRGGRYVSPSGRILEASPRIGPPFYGYKGVVTKDFVYFHYAGGREWLARRDALQTFLSWYRRPDDICDGKLLSKMREMAGVDFENEPEEYGGKSEFYLSIEKKIELNFPYNQKKLALVNELIMCFQDSSVGIYYTNASPYSGRELFLMLSLVNRKKVVGIIDDNPRVRLFEWLYCYPIANLGVPVFPLSEAAQRGVRYIITTSRTEEEELKKFVSESDYPFHVYGLYGWFALCGYHTKYNFWDFVIESMDEKPASELSIPYFLHHASPKAASVAAVIVTQNDEACIAPCLHRLLGEVTTGVEIYCVDLSSTDKTVEIIQGYGKIDSSIHVTVVKQEELWGKLTELLASMGEKYVAFFSPRDILHPRAVSYLHGAAEAAGADVVASCAVLPSSEEGKALEKNIREGNFALKMEAQLIPMVYPACYEEALSQEPSLFHGARLYRTGFLRENKIRLSDEGDGMFFLKVMFQTAKYVRTAEPVCVSESARHGGMQERFRECYERNRKAVNGYRLWHHALPLLPEYGEQPVMPIPLGSGRYAYLNRNEKKISQVFEIRRTDKVEKSFFRDLSRPIIVVGEMNLRHWEHLYQNLAKSEDFGADNHVYLCYNTLDEFLLLLQVEDISPYLAEEKFVFLFGQRDVAENYPLDFENIYHETYRQEGNVPILRRILPGDHWQGLADKEFQAWLDKSARGILASREFEMSDLSRLYAIYEDVAVGK